MRIFYLGLFDWKNKLLGPDQVEAVARIFLGESGIHEDNDGWFRKWKVDSFDRVSVTHSRIIIEQSMTDDDLMSFADLRKTRRNFEDRVSKYLHDRLDRPENSKILIQILGRSIPTPFVYLYPLVILRRANGLYANEFVKDDDGQWRVPVDLSTSCFFAALSDTGKPWWRFDMEKSIYLRISGSSLVMGSASNRFTHRIINMLYYAGLYEMTRISEKLSADEEVFFGLEPLLEKQGQEITNSITQRTVEERVEVLNQRLLALTILGLILAALALWR